MSSRIIIDGNAIYEVDEECLRKKKEKEQEEEHEKQQEKHTCSNYIHYGMLLQEHG